MKPSGLLRSVVALLPCLSVPGAFAADTAHELLMKINRAADTLNYDGIFVYQHGDVLESLRITHKVSEGGVQERLLSLNGAAREIIRTNREVRCYLPDENSVVVEHRQANGKRFPALLPESFKVLDHNYVIKLGKKGRVADRLARAVIIKPRDAYRYGYQLWADQASGLLLKASLVDDRDGVIEQFMFTQVTVGMPIADANLQPHNPGKGFVWHREDTGAQTAGVTGGTWMARELPRGFELSSRMTRRLPTHRLPVEHLVYSDGLAVVSVFIERIDDESQAGGISGLTYVGAAHAFGKVLDQHQITVVGEAPAVTVDLIGSSVVRAP